MEHPRMFADDDPLLVRVRELAARFPESSEVEAWGRPTFRAGRKLFAVYGDHHHAHGLVFKPDPDERPALLSDPRFVVPPYFGPAGWLALDRAADEPDWQEVLELLELLESSYRQVALVRMRPALDAAPVLGPGSAPPGTTPPGTTSAGTTSAAPPRP